MGNSEKRGTPKLAGGDIFKMGNCQTGIQYTLYTRLNSNLDELYMLGHVRLIKIFTQLGIVTSG